MNKIIVGFLAGAVVAAAGVALFYPSLVKSPDTKVSAASSPDVYSYQYVHGVFTQGGPSFATSSVGASTLADADMSGAGVVERSGSGTLTMTLPASTTISGLTSSGDCRDIQFVNYGSGLLTLAGGTGTLLETASSTKTVNTNGMATLKFCRMINTDIEVLMNTGS